MKNPLFLIAGIVMVAASMENEAIPAWEKIAESGRILEPQLKQRLAVDARAAPGM